MARNDAWTSSLRRILTIGSWLALGWLMLLYVIRPELRSALRSYLHIGYLLVAWFLLARTKTLSWQSVAGLFAICIPWAAGVGLIGHRLAGAAGLGTADLGACTALAALAEESLSLLPLIVLIVLFPARIRRFSVTDWLLAGIACGLAFQAVEEFTRLDGAHAHYGFSPISGGLSMPGGAFAGRHILTALTATTIGLAIAGWRHATNRMLSPVARIIWRGLAVIAPLGCWWLTVSVHAGYNATRVIGSDWFIVADPSMPRLLSLGWRLGRHGAGLGWLLLALLVIALFVDAGRLRNAAEVAEDPLPSPFAPTQTTDRWAGRLTRWAGTRTALPIAAAVWLIANACALAAYTLRDLDVVLVAHGVAPRSAAARSAARSGPTSSPRRRESRWSAIARGRAAVVMIRSIRAEAIALAAAPDSPAGRRVIRFTGLAGLAGLVVAAVWLGPHWAQGIGDSISSSGTPVHASLGDHPIAWLAGLPTTVTSWWDGLSVAEYALLAASFVALLLLSVGPLDLSAREPVSSVLLGARSLRLTGPGQDLALAAGSYLVVTTPVEAALDVAGAVAGALPRPFTAAQTGQNVRTDVREFVADPAVFIASRRAAAEWAAKPLDPLAQVPVRARASADLPPIKLADGRLLAALTDDDEQLFVATLDDLTRGNIRERNDGADYQVRIYGDDERLISHRPEKWSDGQNIAYGMVGDTAYYDGRGMSWYAPETLPESIRHKAYLELDRRLIEYAAVVYYPGSPFRALEMTTNHPLVAQALEERMARLAIPGYVVLEP